MNAARDRGVLAGSTCLHLIVGPGAEALEDCLTLVRAGDAVVFLDAGVLHLLGKGEGAVPGTDVVRFARADLEAQGLLEVARRRRVDVIDDAGICELVAAHRHCLTWA